MDDFLFFVAERHRVWEARQRGDAQPWTEDPVLATRKFTNVFRILDPGTQFVMKELYDPELSERDQLLRLFLYRHTGRIETWDWLALTTGYPTWENLEDVRQSWYTYRGGFKLGGRGSGDRFQAKSEGVRMFDNPMFTSAYLVFPQSPVPGTDKLDSIIDLTKRLFTPGSPDDIMPAWEQARIQQERFKALRSNKGVGDFMSMQVLADWSYFQERDLEDEFLMPGPGSVKGAAALDPNARTMDVVKRVVREVRGLPDCPRLGYRVPSLMDIGSNLLCEWSKYVRFREKPVPSKIYKPAHPGEQPAPVLPSYYSEGADLL